MPPSNDEDDEEDDEVREGTLSLMSHEVGKPLVWLPVWMGMFKEARVRTSRGKGVMLWLCTAWHLCANSTFLILVEEYTDSASQTTGLMRKQTARCTCFQSKGILRVRTLWSVPAALTPQYICCRRRRWPDYSVGLSVLARWWCGGCYASGVSMQNARYCCGLGFVGKRTTLMHISHIVSVLELNIGLMLRV